MHIGGVMINIEEERKAFEIEWIKLGGDFKSFLIIDNMYVLIPSMASADDVIKEFAERAVNSAFALWLIQSRQKQVVIDDLNSQLEKAKATPEGFVLMPSGVLDLTRFMCETWTEIDKFVYKNCQNLELYPLIQGSKTQSAIRKIGKQKFNPFAVGAGIQAMIEAQEQSHD